LYTQTTRHRDYFVGSSAGFADDDVRLPRSKLMLSVGLLLVALLAVVLLAKKFSLVVDAGVAATGAPPAVAGVLVALLILLPESVAAISAAVALPRSSAAASASRAARFFLARAMWLPAHCESTPAAASMVPATSAGSSIGAGVSAPAAPTWPRRSP
ncbi:MAG: hypothetical protein E6776_09100, partial [Eggerthella sp.]|nr:hypothetical protein [Eggerthella sp.]